MFMRIDSLVVSGAMDRDGEGSTASVRARNVKGGLRAWVADSGPVVSDQR